MKLATLPSSDRKNRHGELVVVSKDNTTAARAGDVAPTLLAALETWAETRPKLERIYEDLCVGRAEGAMPFRLDQALAPLPHSPGFYDGSAFLSHVVRARRSRGDVMPESAKVTPLMYQGVSDNLLPSRAPLELGDVAYGGDFEGELAVVTTDVPRATPASACEDYIALVVMFNDITYRELVKSELETKFGFLQSKPNSSFAPLALTLDELGNAWKGGRVELDLAVDLNGQRFGHPNGREMHFGFGQLIAHACRTRPLSAGSLVGSGTFSNEDKGRGFACLTEKRCQEIIDGGKPVTPWLKPGDRVRMDVLLDGRSLFGPIDQKVVL